MINGSMPFIKYSSCLSDFKLTFFSPQIFEKYSNTKFNVNSPSETPVFVIRKTPLMEQLL